MMHCHSFCSLNFRKAWAPFGTQEKRRRTISHVHDEVVVPGNAYDNGYSYNIVKTVDDADHSEAAPVGQLRGKKVLVIGAGPAGTCAALQMANLGATVDVYEQRGNEETVAGASSRSYVIILQKRGLDAMEAAGAAVQVDDTNRFLGSVNISKSGKLRKSRGSGAAVGFSRADLAAHLIAAARARHPREITFHLGWHCQDGDLQKRSLTLENAASGETRTVQYDLLIGADGQNSRVRDLFADQIDGFTVDALANDREYKPFAGLDASTLEPAEWREGQSGRSLFLWDSKRAGFTLSANRRSDGVFCGNFGSLSRNFAALESEEDYLRIIQSSFAAVPDGWATQIAQQVASKPVSKFPKTIKCSQMHGPSAVLIGDAAHCVTPILGQGANAALEDSSILARALCNARGDVNAGVQEFDALRRLDAHSLVDLNRFVEKATRLGPFAALFLAPVLLHVVVSGILHRLLPFWFKPPAVTRLDSGVGYRELVTSVLRDCVLFVGAAALVCLFVAWRANAGHVAM